MTTTKTLNQADIENAIAFWLQNAGFKAKSVYLWQDPGDAPVSGPQIFAKVEGKESE